MSNRIKIKFCFSEFGELKSNKKSSRPFYEKTYY